MNEPTDADGLLQGGETTVRWVPRVNDPARPTVEEIAAGIMIGTASGLPDLTFARDEEASTDPGSILRTGVERRLIRRWRLDATHELVQISPIRESDHGGSRGACEHERPHRVETEDGELVGHLCLACETWLPPEWTA